MTCSTQIIYTKSLAFINTNSAKLGTTETEIRIGDGDWVQANQIKGLQKHFSSKPGVQETHSQFGKIACIIGIANCAYPQLFPAYFVVVAAVAATVFSCLGFLYPPPGKKNDRVLAGVALLAVVWALGVTWIRVSAETSLDEIMKDLDGGGQVSIELPEIQIHGNVHDIVEHGIRVNLPHGWQRMEALNGNTTLKLSRTGDHEKNDARIVIVVFTIAEAVDLSSVSRNDYLRTLEDGSHFGETVTALDAGHARIAGVLAVWGKFHRNLPLRGSTYEYTYELFRDHQGVPKAFTIRLTAYGDDDWFQSNSVIFDRFIESIRFNH